MKELSSELKIESQKLEEIEGEWKGLQLRIPSIPLDSVPLGKDDSENVEILKWGEIPDFDFPVKSHVELGDSLGSSFTH